MTGSLPAAVRDRWRLGAGFLFRLGRRTLIESLYLLTAPVIAAAALPLVLGGSRHAEPVPGRWRQLPAR